MNKTFATYKYPAAFDSVVFVSEFEQNKKELTDLVKNNSFTKEIGITSEDNAYVDFHYEDSIREYLLYKGWGFAVLGL